VPWTGQLISGGKRYDLDHLVPLVLYPMNDLWNLVPPDHCQLVNELPVGAEGVEVRTRRGWHSERLLRNDLDTVVGVDRVSSDTRNSVDIEVDGRRFRLDGLGDGEERTVDVASALRRHSHNVVVVRTSGPADGGALLVISD
jgi:hypothetical protein